MTFETVLKEMAAIHKAKSAEYGNSYELSACLLRQPVVVGLLHHMTDKLARACHLAGGVEAQVETSFSGPESLVRTAPRV